MTELGSPVSSESNIAPAAGSGRSGMSKAMPPVAFGGSVAAGIASMLISGHQVIDCIRYQTRPGQCDSVIQTNLPGLVAGGGVLAGCWGAFNTYNPRLHKGGSVGEIAARGLVIPAEPEEEIKTEEPALVSGSGEKAEQEDYSLLVDRVVEKREAGDTQKKIAESLGISIYEVRKALYQARIMDRGR